jgi:Fic family protein
LKPEEAKTVDISQFTSPEMGTLVQIEGHNSRRDEYSEHYAFVPQDLPRTIRLSNKTHALVSTASGAVGQLQQCLKRLPKPEILLRPSLAREAKSTSALEGTYAPLQDILEGDFVEETNMSAAVKEIRNYIRAAYRGLELIKTKPICISVLSELQGITVEGTTGARINQGETRTGQVIIGDDSKPVEMARFIPPPAIAMLKGYNEWEKWINEIDDLSPIIIMALGHYQFETLHPYADGNGRIGRLVISLQFVEKALVNPPVLNLSEWFNNEKEKYKNELLILSQKGDFDRWVSFFSEAIIGQVAQEMQRIEKLVEFQKVLLQKLKNTKERGVVVQLAEGLIADPVFTAKTVSKLYGVTPPPAISAIQKLVDIGVLKEVTGGRYNRIFACLEVINILDR